MSFFLFSCRLVRYRLYFSLTIYLLPSIILFSAQLVGVICPPVQRSSISSGCGEAWYRAWFGSKRPWVQIPPLGPKREAKKDIEDKTSVFSRLPRPVDQQIYGPYFSDILPCAIHSGRSRTHTIFTLSGISFEAGILLLQDLGLFYSAV